MGRLRDITRDFENGTSEWIGKKRYLKWSETQIGTGDLEAEGCSLCNMIRFMFYQRWTPWLVLIYRNGDMVMLISIMCSLLRSSAKTWEYLRTRKDHLPWHKIVWFSEGIPQQSFTVWWQFKTCCLLVFVWDFGEFLGLCLLGERENSRDHLFFAWPNTFTVWGDVAGRLLVKHPNPEIFEKDVKISK